MAVSLSRLEQAIHKALAETDSYIGTGHQLKAISDALKTAAAQALADGWYSKADRLRDAGDTLSDLLDASSALSSES